MVSTKTLYFAALVVVHKRHMKPLEKETCKVPLRMRIWLFKQPTFNHTFHKAQVKGIFGKKSLLWHIIHLPKLCQVVTRKTPKISKWKVVIISAHRVIQSLPAGQFLSISPLNLVLAQVLWRSVNYLFFPHGDLCSHQSLLMFTLVVSDSQAIFALLTTWQL